MRFAIIGTVLATVLSITGAYGQASGSSGSSANMDISGTKDFCSVDAGRANCNFDTAALCEKEIANMGANGQRFACSERSKLGSAK